MTDFTKSVSLPSDESKFTSEDYARLTNLIDDDEVQPRYNFRPHRNRPAYLKDYVTFTFTPNQ